MHESIITEMVDAPYIPLVVAPESVKEKEEIEYHALVVVDMQEKFVETSTILQQCLSLIKDAVARRIPIFFLEYGGFGETHVDLIKPVVAKTKSTAPEILLTEPDGIPLSHFVKKSEMDGSPGIKAVCQKTGLSPLMWKICGVYTSACVLATTKGLLKRFPESKASIVKKAVMDSSWNMAQYEKGTQGHFDVYTDMERTLLV